MIYYEKDYYAVPDTGAEKAYELLRQALLAQKKVAIAKIVMGTNEKGSKINVGVDDFKIDHLSQYFSFIIKRKKPPSASRQTNH